MEKVTIGTTTLELQNGTMRRYPDEAPEYLDVGITENGNKVLFYYTDASEIVNYVETIIDKLPGVVTNYLSYILDNTSNILVRLWYVPNSEASCYEIYYDSDCESNEILDIIDYMGKHNDFAATNYRYTQIKDGHQTVCE